MPIIKICLNCGKEFGVVPSDANRARFCSRACRFSVSLEKKLEIVGYDLSSAGCHIWRGYKNNHGYGVVGHEGRDISVHRASWYVNRGLIPDGINVLHECDVRPCFNVAHLFLGTDIDNIADMDAKGRRYVSRGEEHGMSVLTDAIVREIRSRPHGHGTAVRLGDEFGVSPQTISKIRLRKVWAHVR